mmetsp:Transcript_25334/g.71049  ORF Transcript_25334/g.71049 Transcript_25334/m.71049 type:complete len:330 (-) Transcript_25334:240-1229(-)
MLGIQSASAVGRVALRRTFHATAAVAAMDPTKRQGVVGVVGMGLMGHGIVQMAASAGYNVVAVDVNDAARTKGVAAITNSVQKLAAKAAAKGKMSEEDAKANAEETLARISSSTDPSSLADADLVIEAIVENLDVKKSFYEQLGKDCKPDTIFATNTSSFPVTDMGQASGRPDRMVGLHFFNPVQLMKLVEVVRTDETSAESFDTAFAFAQSLGKVAIGCSDTPGFVVNRLLVPYLAQALTLAERRVASLEDIDTAMQLGAGHPMGPITLADYVGLDTTKYILDGWVEKFPDEPAFFVPPILEEKVKAGKLGRKTGEGFYKWDGDKKST